MRLLFSILLGPLLIYPLRSSAADAPTPPVVSTGTAVSTDTAMGLPLSMDKGPWVLGEILLLSPKGLISDRSLRDRVRGRRDMLYTRSDIESDIGNLKRELSVESARAEIFAIPETQVQPEFYSIAASSHQVRLVFHIIRKKSSVAAPAAKGPSKIPPAAVSGVILTPTAYRGAGKYSSPGLGLDFNAAYFIGRLYGKNTFSNSINKTNYIDRLGVWILSTDGKMQVQSETKWRPALSVGVQGALLFRDSPQPNINTPTVSVKVSQKSTRVLSDAFIVVSKKIFGVRSSAGVLQGNMGDMIGHMSEFLTPEGLEFFAGRPGDHARSRTVPYMSLLYLPKPEYPLGVEMMKFNGAALNPILFNFKIGYFLKLNFDISYLKYDGGYDVLGTLQFRYNHFPRR